MGFLKNDYVEDSLRDLLEDTEKERDIYKEIYCAGMTDFCDKLDALLEYLGVDIVENTQKYKVIKKKGKK